MVQDILLIHKNSALLHFRPNLNPSFFKKRKEEKRKSERFPNRDEKFEEKVRGDLEGGVLFDVKTVNLNQTCLRRMKY